jgi:hypothetical protein
VRKAHRAADLVSALRNPALLHASPRETSSVCLPIPDRLLELLVPSVKHAKEADLSPEMSGVASDFEKRFCTGAK